MLVSQSLHAIPEADRPRERLRKHGVDAMTTAELLAIILGSGMKGKSVLHLSQEIVAHFGSLEALGQATFSELCQIKGLGPAKAIQVLAAVGLSSRITHQQIGPGDKIAVPAQVYRAVIDAFAGEKRELFLTLLLDVRGCLITREVVSVGTLAKTLVHPREVFYPAIRHKAASLVLVHNHPSGNPLPSEEDIVLTRKLVTAGHLMGIPISDHVIIGDGDYASMRIRGDVDFTQKPE